MPSLRDRAMEFRRSILRNNPNAEFEFHVPFETWKEMHVGYPFDEKEPLKTFSRFCGMDVIVDDFLFFKVKA